MSKGKLYGVGVGPGDPEMLTLKAHRLINENKYIAIPGKEKSETRSYLIAEPVMNEPDDKIVISCHVQMTKDKEILDRQYRESADKIIEILKKGENVVYLTLGDPTVYATYMYVHKLVKEAGYPVEIINGIPSFCAAAARLDISLCERDEQLHIIPASYDIDEALDTKGVKVLMKAASRMGDVKEKIRAKGSSAYMVENCCMEDEKIYRGIDEIDEKAGYLSVIIVKD